MITINELRIGNWVYHSEWALEPTKVECINSEGIQQHRGEGGIPDYWPHLDDIIPIPLTPEILEKCGFIEGVSNTHETRQIWGIQVANNHSLYYDPNGAEEWHISHEWNDNSFQNGFWNHPKYLHQLQNLYFALTGAELEYKP